MTYLPWFRKYPDRFAEEKELLESKGFELDENIFSDKLVATFSGLSTGNLQHTLTIVFPASFPGQPPLVYLQDTLLPRHHHPQSKEICTFGFGGSRWTAEMNGYEAILEAEKIIELNSAGIMQEDDNVPEPASLSFPFTESSILVPKNLEEALIALTEEDPGSVRIRITNQETGLIGVVTQLLYKKGRTLNAIKPYSSFCHGAREINARIIKLQKALFYEDAIKMIAGSKKDQSFLFIFPEEYKQRDQYKYAFILLTVDKQLRFLRCFTIDDNEREIRFPELASLKDKNVLIIGTGSLGSRVAIELARVGVKMSLVDHDVQTYGSTFRHECGTFSIGSSKVGAIKKRIADVNPELLNKGNIKLLPFRIGSQHVNGQDINSYQELESCIKDADLIIETTGNHGVRWYINDQAFENNKPALYAWVTNGAWGGEAVYTVPGKTGCYLCWRDFRDGLCTEVPTAPSDGPIFASGCSQPTFTGTSFDIMDFCSKVIRMSVQVLLNGSNSTYPESPGNYLRWSCRDLTGNLSLNTEFYSILRQDICPICNREF